MNKTIVIIIGTILAVVIIEVAGGLILMYTGAYNISTFNHDNAPMNWFLDTGMTRSVIDHAGGIQAPPNLAEPAMVQEGFEHYHEMCVSCHGAPGVKAGEIAKGLWPTAPDLAKTVPTWSPAQLFWIAKYGVKFTAMPALGPTHDDAKLWAIVAFLEKLPKLSPADYQQMVQNSSSSLEQKKEPAEAKEEADQKTP